MLSTLGIIFSRRHIEIFFLFFFQKTGLETICMKCQSYFLRKIRKIFLYGLC